MPVFQQSSLQLFGDVVYPGDDDEVEEVFARPAVQVAAHYVRDVIAVLANHPAPTAADLDRLAGAAGVLVDEDG